ncbi:MAG: histidine phosphotransferase family protein [Pseudomonadota bacterium]|nr:histidine phosphotransferase family protein [Pseudomonadota bacterium]
MTDSLPPDLTALLGSRICHDLISPLGAIGNGLELLQMTGIAEGPELSLVSAAARSANARIRFFRIAFGTAPPDQKIGRGEMASVLDDTYGQGRIALAHDLPADMARADARLALLLILCLETALPTGGDIAVRADAGAWHLSATGPRLSLDDRLWKTMADPHAPGSFTAAEVQFALLRDACARDGKPLNMDLGPDVITVRF